MLLGTNTIEKNEARKKRTEGGTNLERVLGNLLR